MSPETQAFLEMALSADARAHARLVNAAGHAPTSEERDVLMTVAQRVLAQCLGHLDALGESDIPALAVERLHHYATKARANGDQDEAEWLETIARANAVHTERIAEVTS